MTHINIAAVDTSGVVAGWPHTHRPVFHAHKPVLCLPEMDEALGLRSTNIMRLMHTLLATAPHKECKFVTPSSSRPSGPRACQPARPPADPTPVLLERPPARPTAPHLQNLVLLNFNQEAREADFRYGLVRVRENAESIAFYRGNEDEGALLRQVRGKGGGVCCVWGACVWGAMARALGCIFVGSGGVSLDEPGGERQEGAL